MKTEIGRIGRIDHMGRIGLALVLVVLASLSVWTPSYGYPPGPATQASVNAGTEPYLYVTPKTLAGWVSNGPAAMYSTNYNQVVLYGFSGVVPPVLTNGAAGFNSVQYFTLCFTNTSSLFGVYTNNAGGAGVTNVVVNYSPASTFGGFTGGGWIYQPSNQVNNTGTALFYFSPNGGAGPTPSPDDGGPWSDISGTYAGGFFGKYPGYSPAGVGFVQVTNTPYPTISNTAVVVNAPSGMYVGTNGSDLSGSGAIYGTLVAPNMPGAASAEYGFGLHGMSAVVSDSPVVYLPVNQDIWFVGQGWLNGNGNVLDNRIMHIGSDGSISTGAYMGLDGYIDGVDFFQSVPTASSTQFTIGQDTVSGFAFASFRPTDSAIQIWAGNGTAMTNVGTLGPQCWDGANINMYYRGQVVLGHFGYSQGYGDFITMKQNTFGDQAVSTNQISIGYTTNQSPGTFYIQSETTNQTTATKVDNVLAATFVANTIAAAALTSVSLYNSNLVVGVSNAQVSAVGGWIEYHINPNLSPYVIPVGTMTNGQPLGSIFFSFSNASPFELIYTNATPVIKMLGSSAGAPL